MNRKNASPRYGSLSIGLHWLMLILIAVVYACIELKEISPRVAKPANCLSSGTSCSA